MTICAITGTILNIYKKRVCFLYWGITNGFWMTYNFNNGEIQQGFLFTVYFCLAIFGWCTWKEKV